MKRISVILLALLILVLGGCSEKSASDPIEKNGIAYFVDTEKNTISDGSHTYQYDFSGNAESYSLTITYPDGSSYWWQKSGAMGGGGWSEDYREDAYISGEVLSEIVLASAPSKGNSGEILGSIILLVFGGLSIAFPKVWWFLKFGWHFQDAEPSNASLVACRISGVAAIVIGVVLLIR